MVQSSMPGLEISIEDAALAQMSRDHYKPVNGARGITGYIEGVIKPEIANTVLFDGEAIGMIRISYDSEGKSALIEAPQSAVPEALSI
jgi:ATP-dependent Clp protease ATP-binding subunit ClpA